MRRYVVVTASLFGLLVLVHLARGFVEGPHVLADTFFIASTLTAGGLSAWGGWLLRRGAG